jgi:hypothetical protein
MFNFFCGVLLGLAIATVGADGVSKIVNKGVTNTQEIIKDAAK